MGQITDLLRTMNSTDELNVPENHAEWTFNTYLQVKKFVDTLRNKKWRISVNLPSMQHRIKLIEQSKGVCYDLIDEISGDEFHILATYGITSAQYREVIQRYGGRLSIWNYDDFSKQFSMRLKPKTITKFVQSTNDDYKRAVEECAKMEALIDKYEKLMHKFRFSSVSNDCQQSFEQTQDEYAKWFDESELKIITENLEEHGECTRKSIDYAMHVCKIAKKIIGVPAKITEMHAERIIFTTEYNDVIDINLYASYGDLCSLQHVFVDFINDNVTEQNKADIDKLCDIFRG